MSGLNKLFAGLGVCLAFIAVTRLIPQQTVVIKPDRTWHVIPRDAKDKKSTAAEAGKSAKASRAAKTPQTAQAVPVPSTQPAAGGDDAPATTSQQSAAIAPSVETAPPNAATAKTAPLSFDAADKEASEQAAPADPWAPVVTRAGEEPAKNSPEAPDAYSGLFTKPETANKETGIADSDPRIAPILAAHPDRDLILCLAGCGNGISVVEIRRRPQAVAVVTAEMVPTSGSVQMAQATGDVVCIAGCVGRQGEVVFKNVRLSWISDEGSSHVKQALRAIADRIVASEGLDIEAFPRTWVSDMARVGLIGEPAPTEPFSFAGARVAGWMTRVPVAALED